MRWFRKKSRLEYLKQKYRDLMRKSYRIALKDPKESDRVHEKADKVYEEIEYLKLKYGDK